MSNVYSNRLIQAPAVSGGPLAAYTVPIGIRAVVRCIVIVWGSVLLTGLDAWVIDSSGTKLARRAIGIGTSNYEVDGGCDVFEGHWCYQPGESLSVQTASGTADFLASGYELTLP